MRLLESYRLPSRPPWMHRARPATRMEDRSGIDIVVESDVGALLVQVKSSSVRAIGASGAAPLSSASQGRPSPRR
jgi:hypothetical protein